VQIRQTIDAGALPVHLVMPASMVCLICTAELQQHRQTLQRS
jgi:hypothetical protein